MIAAIMGLSSCGTSSQPKTLPEGAEVVTYQYSGKSFRKGVTGPYNGSPRPRKPAMMEINYTISCLDTSDYPSAKRYGDAVAAIKRKYFIAPLYFSNPRERGAWRRNANDMILDQTGCEISRLEYGKIVDLPIPQ